VNAVIRATLSDQAYEELRQRILSGVLATGKRLLPEELATSLSISPTPIKEALLRLEADGLVFSPTRRGSVVREFTPADVDEIYETRTILELHALDRVMSSGTAEAGLVDRLRHCLEQHEGMHARGVPHDDPTMMFESRRFHELLMEAANNRMIAEWHKRTMDQLQAAVHAVHEETASVLDEHRAILAAIADGDLPAATEAMLTHLTKARLRILELIAKSRGTA
jgi:DNA-binding GntR family transcriptional regulator